VSSVKDYRIELAMTQQTLNHGITFVQPYEGIWYVYLDGMRVGTVNGDSVMGFTARNTDYRSIGRGYANAEEAMQAWVPVMERHV
jgi:hypothetical protein